VQAAIFHGAGKPLTIETVPDPAPGPGELVLKVEACGICGSDLHMADIHDGGGMPALPAGTVMGHEFAGEVVAIGSELKERWQLGTRVTAMPLIGCGKCLACLSGKGLRCATGKGIGLGASPGAYAEYIRVGGYESFRLPEQVDYQAGAMVEPLAVGLHAVNVARLQPGDSVLVMGAGPIGLAVATWCRFFGARHVVVSDLVKSRLDRASDFGATGCIEADREDVAQRVVELAGEAPPIVFDCVGVPGSQQLAMHYAPVDGRVVVVGVCMKLDHLLPIMAIGKELQINYVLAYRHQDFAFTIQMLAAGRIDPQPMLSGIVGFEGFPAAFEALKTSKQECKVLLHPH
jgi:(R,R)-butanediol dehydrogenase / meso-butanediol dehydrogenase / diacetyl reductase